MAARVATPASDDRWLLAERGDLAAFLAGVERRAFAMARAVLGDEEEALDAVQDAMYLLVRRYRHRGADEWRLLFFRILTNRLRDLLRRRAVRDRFSSWLPRRQGDAEEEEDPFQTVADPRDGDPCRVLERRQGIEELERALRALPRRQREAFLLRCWEGLSTADAARAMGCSEGSVKTHYFRALKTLKEILHVHRDA